jgi:hypothetical protein
MISPDEARALGRDYVASHLIELNLDENPPPAYNFVPSEWFLFAVRVSNKSSIGASHYVAVHKETGEVRYADRLWE